MPRRMDVSELKLGFNASKVETYAVGPDWVAVMEVQLPSIPFAQADTVTLLSASSTPGGVTTSLTSSDLRRRGTDADLAGRYVMKIA